MANACSHGVSRWIPFKSRIRNQLLLSVHSPTQGPDLPQGITSQIQAQKVKDVLRFVNGGLVLDAGCGDGRVSRVLAHGGFDVVGCDRSVWQIHSSKTEPRDASGRLRVCVASLTNLPFRTLSFDSICCLDVLEHISDLGDALTEMKRVLRNGGSLIIAVPAVAHGLVYDRILLRTSISKYVLKKLGYLDHIEEGHFHVRLITPGSARLQFEALGMKVDSFRNVSFLSTYLETIGNLLAVLGFRGKNPFDQVVALDLKIAKHLPLSLGSSWLIVLHKKKERDS